MGKLNAYSKHIIRLLDNLPKITTENNPLTVTVFYSKEELVITASRKENNLWYPEQKIGTINPQGFSMLSRPLN